ncbi:hypothetical protein ARMGADRAFT_1020077, partial [Armillaria gallica]
PRRDPTEIEGAQQKSQCGHERSFTGITYGEIRVVWQRGEKVDSASLVGGRPREVAVFVKVDL